MTYKSKYSNGELPDAYERLILDVIHGDKRLFIRNDELEAAWKLFTPLLETIESENIPPELYCTVPEVQSARIIWPVAGTLDGAIPTDFKNTYVYKQRRTTVCISRRCVVTAVACTNTLVFSRSFSSSSSIFFLEKKPTQLYDNDNKKMDNNK